MNYHKINKFDIANGTGVRVSLFVSGCTNQCKGCFNPETWDFCSGTPYTKATEAEVISALNHPMISGLTILGGDPMHPRNQRGIFSLVEKVRKEFPTKTIWIFTGYVWEDFLAGHKAHTEVSEIILRNVDVMVDGPFIEEQKDLRLKFRGSSNQRLIDVKKTFKSGEIALFS